VRIDEEVVKNLTKSIARRAGVILGKGRFWKALEKNGPYIISTKQKSEPIIPTRYFFQPMPSKI